MIAGITYYYRLRACNNSGCSDYSNYDDGFLSNGDSFLDVPSTHHAYQHITALGNQGIASGCGGNKFCPEQVMSRNTAAIWLAKAMQGAGYTPPVASGSIYSDVQTSTFAAAYIEDIGFNRGVSEGCNNTSTLYCPTAPVTRNQAARLLIRAKGLWEPPTGSDDLFEDVAADDFASGAIEKMVVLGYLEGCDEQLFCPNQTLTRAAFGRMLVNSFELLAQ